MTPTAPLSQEQRKTLVAEAALGYVPAGQIIGVGTGSTVNHFIAALARIKDRVQGAVSSSEASSERLRAIGVEVFDANAVLSLPVYIDGADEIDDQGHLLKGGGAALTREKIVAALAERFVCIADASKRVHTLGRFPLPVEVIPMAARHIARRFAAMGAQASLRMAGGRALLTDNGLHLLDVAGLSISDPLALESQINQWPGVVTVGLFAQHKATLCLLGTDQGVQTLDFRTAA